MVPHIAGPLHLECLGTSGLPMLFVHPNPMDHTCWLYQMAHLSTWFRTVGVDLPGYGRSPRAEPGVSMEHVALACWEALDRVTREPAILVGLSIGGEVIRRMTHQRPERVLALVIAGHGYRPVRSNMAARAEQYEQLGLAFRRQHTLEDYSRGFGATPMASYFAEMYEERNAFADAQTIARMFRARSQPEPDWLSTGIQAPTLMITGSEDKAHQASLAMQQRIRDSELVTIDGAGHACNMEQPWAFDRAMLQFLAARGLFTPQAGVSEAG